MTDLFYSQQENTRVLWTKKKIANAFGPKNKKHAGET
jgi:hypothetical protein